MIHEIVLLTCLALPRGEFESAEPPKLVVLIVIDQFPAWVIPRLERHFVSGGFRRLMDNGVWLRQAYYPQAATITAVGHATIATGAPPAGHGIPGNLWFDRATDREIYCVADDSTQTIGHATDSPAGVSPRLLTATTFADECRIASGFRSKTIAISAKDRSAILLGGHTGSAFWYSQKSGMFLSSSYYFREGRLPAWVEQFNADRPADRHRGKSWTPLLDVMQYEAPPDDRDFEIDFPGLGRTFPHRLGDGIELGGDYYKALSVTPLGSELLLDFARAALAAERLGERGVTDTLCISLTSNDYVGHAFGPESIEYLDMTLRTDRQLDQLFRDLDDRLGKGRWLAVLTADHGVCPSPEFLRSKGMDVGRVDPQHLRATGDAALDAAFGADDWLAEFNDPGLAIRAGALRRHATDLGQAQRKVADAVRDIPGIAAAFPAVELRETGRFGGAIERAAFATLHPERGPDVVVVPRPYWYLSREMHQHAAMHGTPYAYDAHVPVFFYGARIAPAQIEQRVSLLDVAPTIAAILGTPCPSASDGRSLAELLTGHPR